MKKPIKDNELQAAIDQVLFGAGLLVVVVWCPVQIAIAFLRAWGVEVGH